MNSQLHPLFQMMLNAHHEGARISRQIEAEFSAHPTLHQKQTEEEIQQLMGEANEGVPQFEPTEADLRRMAAEFDETFSEGRIHRPAHRINPHD